jgi:hypothetical protein
MKRAFWILAVGALLSAAMAVGLSRATDKSSTSRTTTGTNKK